jgi:branched-chain amino acid aminotransferase
MTATVPTRTPHSRTWTFFDGAWHEGNVAIMGPRTHAAWLGSMVFDGARRFEGVAPDLDLHLARVNRSAQVFGLDPVVTLDAWMELTREGMARFDPAVALYIRPMYWAETGGVGGGVMFDPASTRWCLCIHEAPMPADGGAQAITLSPYRRPTPECAPVEAKAGCLYPNSAHAIREATGRGFDNALLRDAIGNIAELANANVFMVRDGAVLTPAPNGSFLDGITRQRIVALLRADGTAVRETRLTYADFQQADEIFAAGNFAKLRPVTRIDDRDLQPGPVYHRARRLYWDYAHTSG